MPPLRDGDDSSSVNRRRSAVAASCRSRGAMYAVVFGPAFCVARTSFLFGRTQDVGVGHEREQPPET